MSNWKLINKTYLYDGTFYGFLTIVFKCYTEKTLPQKIYCYKNYIENFLDHTGYIETDYEKPKEYLMELKKIFAMKLYITVIMPFCQTLQTRKFIY